MLTVNGNTKIFAVLGNPLEHSLSPVMYNAAFSALGMNSIYVALQVKRDQLGDAVQGLKALGIQGGNVTIPFKEEIMPYLDELTKEARLIGAVNTFYWEEDRLWGDNTDGAGFLAALQKVTPNLLDYTGTLLLGAGGAARAVGVALALAGIKNFTIVNRHRERAKELASLLESLGSIVSIRNWQGQGLKEAFSENRLVVNTTPLGMSPQKKESPPVEEKWFNKGQLVIDLIYKPQETLFLQKAKARGCETLNGMSMLLAQGILAFEKWSGQKAPKEVMAQALERWV
ncbi:MAG: shikimate dehydrogenase [Clostridia bacterium]|nr:shikimate dehydrogenase [Clostridia bacterium]MDD4146679.1 shikimate dehydrogenase [Clostridia bacterium]MDD4665651.1 shikimate dehydrogenase [Clostridia bacterium]